MRARAAGLAAELGRSVRGQRASEGCLAEAEARLVQAEAAAAALADQAAVALAAATAAADAAGAGAAAEAERRRREEEGEREAEGVWQRVSAMEEAAERAAGALGLVGALGRSESSLHAQANPLAPSIVLPSA